MLPEAGDATSELPPQTASASSRKALNLTPDQCLSRLKAETVPKVGSGYQREHRSNYSKQEVSGKEPFDDPYNYISVWDVLWLRRGASLLFFLKSISLPLTYSKDFCPLWKPCVLSSSLSSFFSLSLSKGVL